jgi:hypothetical protein
VSTIKIHPYDMFVLLRYMNPFLPLPEKIGTNLEVVHIPDGSYTKRNQLFRIGGKVYEETTSAPIITKEFS